MGGAKKKKVPGLKNPGGYAAIVVVRTMGQWFGVRGRGAGVVGVGTQYRLAGIKSSQYHDTLEYPGAVVLNAIPNWRSV